MTGAQDWNAIRNRWVSDFQTISDALTNAIDEVMSKQTKKQLEHAIKITNKHRDIILEILEKAEYTDRAIHGSDFAAARRK